MCKMKRDSRLTKFRNPRNLPACEKAGRMSPTRRGKRVLPLVDFNRNRHRIHREFRKGTRVYERSEPDIKLRLITFKTGQTPPARPKATAALCRRRRRCRLPSYRVNCAIIQNRFYASHARSIHIPSSSIFYETF